MKQPLLPRFFLMSLLCGASMLSSGCISGCTTLFKPYEKRARAVLLPTAGNTARGTVAFVERADGMQVSYSIQGLAANRLYGFQIHEYGNCSVRDARSAGDVFALVKRLGKSTTDDPEGRMPDIRADANGVATGFIVVSDPALDGIRSVENRSIVILRLNNEASTVARRSAPRLACGVIRPQYAIQLIAAFPGSPYYLLDVFFLSVVFFELNAANLYYVKLWGEIGRAHV